MGTKRIKEDSVKRKRKEMDLELTAMNISPAFLDFEVMLEPDQPCWQAWDAGIHGPSWLGYWSAEEIREAKELADAIAPIAEREKAIGIQIAAKLVGGQGRGKPRIAARKVTVGKNVLLMKFEALRAQGFAAGDAYARLAKDQEASPGRIRNLVSEARKNRAR